MSAPLVVICRSPSRTSIASLMTISRLLEMFASRMVVAPDPSITIPLPVGDDVAFEMKVAVNLDAAILAVGDQSQLSC